jgi:hypothetical protein
VHAVVAVWHHGQVRQCLGEVHAELHRWNVHGRRPAAHGIIGGDGNDDELSMPAAAPRRGPVTAEPRCLGFQRFVQKHPRGLGSDLRFFANLGSREIGSELRSSHRSRIRDYGSGNGITGMGSGITGTGSGITGMGSELRFARDRGRGTGVRPSLFEFKDRRVGVRPSCSRGREIGVRARSSAKSRDCSPSFVLRTGRGFPITGGEMGKWGQTRGSGKWGQTFAFRGRIQHMGHASVK